MSNFFDGTLSEILIQRKVYELVFLALKTRGIQENLSESKHTNGDHEVVSKIPQLLHCIILYD